MTTTTRPAWRQAIEAAAIAQQQRVNPSCPWGESDMRDYYRTDADIVLAVALPYLLADLIEWIGEAGEADYIQRCREIQEAGDEADVTDEKIAAAVAWGFGLAAGAVRNYQGGGA